MNEIINELGHVVLIDVGRAEGRQVRIEIVGPTTDSTWLVTIDEADEIRRQLNEVLGDES